MIKGSSSSVRSDRNRAAECAKETRDPHADERHAEDDRADSDRTTLNGSERVPTVVSDVVVDAVKYREGNDGNDWNDERMKVHSLVDMPLK
jgi:hypothetical protein